MRIEWLAKATEDLDAIVDYISRDRPNAARAVLGRIQSRIALLADQPLLGRLGRLPETHELVITRTPYIVAYRVTPERIVILSLVHGARRWPEGFS